jgi:hypothetical protein
LRQVAHAGTITVCLDGSCDVASPAALARDTELAVDAPRQRRPILCAMAVLIRPATSADSASIATLVGELGDGLQKTQQCDSRSLRT